MRLIFVIKKSIGRGKSMLRRNDDMKDWQKETLQEPIVGIKAPEGIPVDDAPEIPEDFVPEMKPVESETEKPKRKGRPKKEEKTEE